jgi:hypothetical protein
MTILFDLIATAALGLSIYNFVKPSFPKLSATRPASDLPAQSESKNEWSGHSREVRHKLFHRGHK